jgi:hypothetical protein
LTPWAKLLVSKYRALQNDAHSIIANFKLPSALASVRSRALIPARRENLPLEFDAQDDLMHADRARLDQSPRLLAVGGDH